MKRCRECAAVENDEVDQCPSCAARAWVVEPALVVDGRYEVRRKIGRGAMGIVYQAEDIGLGRPVALKMISPMYAREPAMIERFQREARAIAALRNDHVVQVYAFGPHGRSYYFAMEYVEGKTLATILDDHVQHQTVVSLDRALTVMRQIASGLTAVHDKGLVHRDVKPSNIVIEQDTGRPVVIDFGLVLQPNRGLLAKTMRSGTPSYMAPEQSSQPVLDTSVLGPRTDVYSLACTAFELFTGKPPFTADDIQEVWLQHQTLAPPTIASLRNELAVLEPVLARALEKDPALRYASCEGFAHALEKAAAPLLGRKAPPLVPRPTAQPTASMMGALLRVLVITPHDALRATVASALSTAAGGKATAVDAAASFAEAERELRKSPDLVVVELGANLAETLSFVAHARDLPDGGHVRVLVLSDASAAGDRWRFDVYGVRDFADTPTDDESLTHALRRIGVRVGWAK